MAFGKPILSWCEISLVLHRSWSGLTSTLSGIVFTLVLFYESQFHTGTLSCLQISLSACSRGGCLVKTACGRPTFTSSGHLPSACWSSSCLNWPALGSLNCLGPGAWEPGGLRSGSNWLRVKHATGRSATPTCQTRAACGGRGNRMRGDTSGNKENCSSDTGGGGSCRSTASSRRTDSLNWRSLSVLPTKLKLLYCLFSPTTGLPIIVDTAGGAATRLQNILKSQKII